MSTDNTGYATKIGEEIIKMLKNNFLFLITEARKGFFWGLGFGFSIWCLVQVLGDFV